MLDNLQHLPLFIGAGLLLNITPGADMALIASRSASAGCRTGAAAALGVSAGCMVHILAGALGMAALLAGCDLAFALLRWLGAAYLVWLGLSLWRQGPTAADPTAHPTPAPALHKVFVQGFLTNALNPKLALFFLAFVPQFIQPLAAHPGAAFVLLGAVFIVNGTLVNLLFAAAVAALARQRRARQARQALTARGAGLARWLNRGVGAVFIGLGLRLAMLDGHS